MPKRSFKYVLNTSSINESEEDNDQNRNALSTSEKICTIYTSENNFEVTHSFQNQNILALKIPFFCF